MVMKVNSNNKMEDSKPMEINSNSKMEANKPTVANSKMVVSNPVKINSRRMVANKPMDHNSNNNKILRNQELVVLFKRRIRKLSRKQ